MLYEDEDDFFMGSPKSKFFDIVFNANRELVKTKLAHIIDRYSALEILLEKEIGAEKLEAMIHTVLMDVSSPLFQLSQNHKPLSDKQERTLCQSVVCRIQSVGQVFLDS